MRSLFLKTFLALFMSVRLLGTAHAGMLLKQNADGSASWERTGNNSGNTYVVGQKLVTFQFENISSIATIYIPIPASYQVTAVYSAITGAISGADARLTFIDHNGTEFTALTIANSGSAAGDIDSSTGLSVAVGSTASPYTIGVGTDGLSTGDVDAYITIVLDPY